MEYAIPGFIERFCTPNALLTLMEYLVDYAPPETRKLGEKVIDLELQHIKNDAQRSQTIEKLKKIKESENRDIYF